MLKIELTNGIEEFGGHEVLSTNYPGLFISIQGKEGNRNIVVLSDNNGDSLEFQNGISKKIESSGVYIPEGMTAVGIFGKGSYSHDNFQTNEHYYKKVDNDYRGLGIGSLMMKIKEELDGILLMEEYSRKISGINFLLRNGFKINGKINKNCEHVKFTNSEESQIYTLLSKYISKSISDKILDETIVFKRKLKQINKS